MFDEIFIDLQTRVTFNYHMTAIRTLIDDNRMNNAAVFSDRLPEACTLIGMTLKEIAGEIVVLVAASIYIAAASLKNGLWTRNIQPTIKSNLATSIIPALILGVFWTIRSIVILDKSISESSVQIVIAVLSAYVVCFLMLEILRRVYKHQREKLDDVEEEGKG